MKLTFFYYITIKFLSPQQKMRVRKDPQNFLQEKCNTPSVNLEYRQRLLWNTALLHCLSDKLHKEHFDGKAFLIIAIFHILYFKQ